LGAHALKDDDGAIPVFDEAPLGAFLAPPLGMTLMHVPVIDIAPFLSGGARDKQAVADEVGQACRDIGFLVISGHGVDPELIARTDALSRAFFDLPLAAKLAVKRPAMDVTRGYIPIEAEAVAASRGEKTEGDLNESFMIGPVDVDPADPYFTRPEAGKHFHPNLWPEAPEGLKQTYVDYYRAMGALAQQIMRIFALALDLPETFFDDKVDRHISRLRVRNYPEQLTPPKPGQLRAGAHCDYGSLTILKAEANPGGLQVFNKAGEWVDVPITPGAYIVNLGELMARWTNDVWVSTLHRVVNPPADKAAGSRRQSLIFFHNPNYDAEIVCLPGCAGPDRPVKYEATTSGGHLRAQFVRTQAPAAIA
jgi:isopenicillin N synthase-like dioxygenase